MKILIIGLGYAGTRFLHAFRSLEASGLGRFDIAYVDRERRNEELPFLERVDAALDRMRPDIAVVSVNDVYRADVMKGLAGFRGFVLCEKPFVCPWDEIDTAKRCFDRASGFALNLVERYSEATIALRDFVRERDLELVRCNFTWGKDRIGDHRPTCGVTSEIIHPLDLVQFVSGRTTDYKIVSAHGTLSDFSVSGEKVVDSVGLLAHLDDAPVFGYASFVNASRRREIGFVFTKRSGGLILAIMTFDDPAWDIDHVRAWELTGANVSTLLEIRTSQEKSASGALGVKKLIHLVSDACRACRSEPPSLPFAGLEDTIRLQRTLNTIHDRVGNDHVVSFSRYAAIPITASLADWERLG